MALDAVFAGPVGSTSPLNTVVLILWNVEVDRHDRGDCKELVNGVRIANVVGQDLEIHETRVEMEERRGGKGAGAIVKTGM